MRRSRLTYKGAFHHVMARGLNGETIFFEEKSKKYLLSLIKKAQKLYKIRIFAYCIMNNHYHIILENSSAKLSEFLRFINGNYASNYRFRKGGRGYVFQDRYKSTLIQNDDYLITAIIYVLLNPVRAGILRNPYDYSWSSINSYFLKGYSKIIDNKYVENIFENKRNFHYLIRTFMGKDNILPIKKTRFGDIIGDDSFIGEFQKNFNRRSIEKTSSKMRYDDWDFESLPEVIKEFEKANKISLSKIDTKTSEGRHLRSKLLVVLKEKAGIHYKEIIKMPVFSDLKYSSLGVLYKRAKSKLQNNNDF